MTKIHMVCLWGGGATHVPGEGGHYFGGGGEVQVDAGPENFIGVWGFFPRKEMNSNHTSRERKKKTVQAIS